MENAFINVVFMHPTTDQVMEVEVDPNMTADGAINELLATDFVPDNSTHGGYMLLIKDTNTVIHGSQTLAEGGVRDAGGIRVVPATNAG